MMLTSGRTQTVQQWAGLDRHYHYMIYYCKRFVYNVHKISLKLSFCSGNEKKKDTTKTKWDLEN